MGNKMGAKFYRGADKSKKIRKRFSQSRSFFRTHKWLAYHAHPLMVAGHPFKGALAMSAGYLTHPDMKRFGINDSTLFVPPNPAVYACVANMAGAQEDGGVPSFQQFFAS